MDQNVHIISQLRTYKIFEIKKLHQKEFKVSTKLFSGPPGYWWIWIHCSPQSGLHIGFRESDFSMSDDILPQIAQAFL